jgi:hypothetical protein
MKLCEAEYRLTVGSCSLRYLGRCGGGVGAYPRSTVEAAVAVAVAVAVRRHAGTISWKLAAVMYFNWPMLWRVGALMGKALTVSRAPRQAKN